MFWRRFVFRHQEKFQRNSWFANCWFFFYFDYLKYDCVILSLIEFSCFRIKISWKYVNFAELADIYSFYCLKWKLFSPWWFSDSAKIVGFIYIQVLDLILWTLFVTSFFQNVIVSSRVKISKNQRRLIWMKTRRNTSSLLKKYNW